MMMDNIHDNMLIGFISKLFPRLHLVASCNNLHSQVAIVAFPKKYPQKREKQSYKEISNKYLHSLFK